MKHMKTYESFRINEESTKWCPECEGEGEKTISIEPNNSSFEVDFQLNYNNPIIGKQRNGPIGTVKLDFHKALTKFVDKEHRGEAPIEVVFESVADVNKETNIDMPVL